MRRPIADAFVTGAFRTGEDCVKALKGGVIEFDIKRLYARCELLHGTRTDDRGGDGRVMECPRKRDIRGLFAKLLAEAFPLLELWPEFLYPPYGNVSPSAGNFRLLLLQHAPRVCRRQEDSRESHQVRTALRRATLPIPAGGRAGCIGTARTPAQENAVAWPRASHRRCATRQSYYCQRRGAIDVRGIEEVNAELEGLIHLRVAFALGRMRTVVHGSKTEAGDF